VQKFCSRSAERESANSRGTIQHLERLISVSLSTKAKELQRRIEVDWLDFCPTVSHRFAHAINDCKNFAPNDYRDGRNDFTDLEVRRPSESLRPPTARTICRRVEFISRPSARFRHSLRRGLSRRRGRDLYVLFDQIPNRCRKQDTDQLRAPVFQRQSGPQDGNQYRAPVLRGLSLHNCCAAKFSARNQIIRCQVGVLEEKRICPSGASE
jgi:hypothetical protein